MGPYIVSDVFPYSAVKIQDLQSGAKFKVNAQMLTQFLELLSTKDVECLTLLESSSDDDVLLR